MRHELLVRIVRVHGDIVAVGPACLFRCGFVGALVGVGWGGGGGEETDGGGLAEEVAGAGGDDGGGDDVGCCGGWGEGGHWVGGEVAVGWLFLPVVG